tara:strand:+ start:154 stop:330 length:177 start_codon:yes stop_codon:yes gene_type:complete
MYANTGKLNQKKIKGDLTFLFLAQRNATLQIEMIQSTLPSHSAARTLMAARLCSWAHW